jgi:hypothetical protein
MNAVVIEHVKVSELPEDWRARLQAKSDTRVTVRIEEEAEQTAANQAEPFVTNDPAFGIWRDREDMADVNAYVRKLRAPRFPRE